MMDGIFGHNNFRNEIVWRRTFSTVVHQSGEIYTRHSVLPKSDRYVWNKNKTSYDPNYIEMKYRHEDKRGRYRLVVLTEQENQAESPASRGRVMTLARGKTPDGSKGLPELLEKEGTKSQMGSTTD